MSARGLWRRSLERGGQWRYLAFFGVMMLPPTALAFIPIASFFQSLFDRSPHASAFAPALPSWALIEVVRQLSEPVGAGIQPGLIGAMLVALLIAPVLAGAAAALARAEAPIETRVLLRGAAEFYGRMLRMSFAACVPLGLAAAVAGGAFHVVHSANENAVLESSASHGFQIASAVTVLAFWLANVTVEAGRAHFAAEPDRRSALRAWWSGVRLTLRRPRQVLGLCVVTSLLAVGAAAVLTAFRLHLVQASTGAIAFGFVLGQLAVMALAWGRSARMVGLVELIRGGDAT